MKYEDTVELSAELLRQALPLMSRHGAALHPVSYAVWYEYVARRHPVLVAAVDERLQRDGRLDEACTQALFREHVAPVNPEVAQRVTEGLQRVLRGMAESASHAGDQTARFGDSLSRLSERLLDPADDSASAVREALADTGRMSEAMAALQRRLDESRHEVELLREEVRRARDESLQDGLTGLANRRAFDQRLSECLEDAGEACLVVGDIDHFKHINDNFGHGFGDQVLRAVAQVIQAHAPGEGLAARIGGEEFALLLPGTAVGDAHALAERLRATLSASRIRRPGEEGTLARVTLSFGVAALSQGDSPQALLERADQALYTSKRGGRDRVTVAA